MRRRRFPTDHAHVRYVQPAQLHPDREITRMKLNFRYRYTPGSSTGIPSSSGCTDALFISLNNIYNPGAQGPWSSSLRQPTGFISLTLLYRQWQVRGARITVKLFENNTPTSGVPQQDPWQWLIVPMSSQVYSSQFGGAVATTPFDCLKMMPGRSKCVTLSQQPYQGPIGSNKTLRCFTSPQRLEDPGYLQNLTSSGGVGSTAVPTHTPVFAIVGSHQDGLIGSGFFIDFEVTVEYSVLFFDRYITLLVGEGKAEPPPTEAETEDMDEKEFDLLPERMAAMDPPAGSAGIGGGAGPPPVERGIPGYVSTPLPTSSLTIVPPAKRQTPLPQPPEGKEERKAPLPLGRTPSKSLLLR